MSNMVLLNLSNYNQVKSVRININNNFNLTRVNNLVLFLY